MAFAKIVFSPEWAIGWALARTPHQKPHPLPSRNRFGDGVDSGTGAFMDAAAGWAAVFGSGEGVGFYESWIGYDRHGATDALVTDFDVVPWNRPI